MADRLQVILRGLREERGETLRETAAAIGISDDTLGTIERGSRGCDPKLSTYVRLCRHLGVSPGVLLQEAVG